MAIAHLDLKLPLADFVELTLAQYQDMVLHHEYTKILENETQRQLMVNAIATIESNKNSKSKQFKDIEIYKEHLKMFDYIMNEYEEIEIVVDHKSERQKLFGG